MKILTTWTVREGCLKEALSRHQAGKGNPPEGVKLLGRWYTTDARGGYAVYECEDVPALASFALAWADVLEVHHIPVVDDTQVGAVLAKAFAK